MWIVGVDVGGTTTRLGVFDFSGTRPQRVASHAYGTRDFSGIPDMTTAETLGSSAI